VVDEVTAKLAVLEESLRADLAGYATVERNAIDKEQSFLIGWDVRLSPVNATALQAGWAEFPDHEIVLWAGHGGRWELSWTADDVLFVERVIRAVVAGRVVERLGLHWASVKITFSDGTSKRTTVIAHSIPFPGWRKWRRKVHYSSYLPTDI
jgi:hypothetical protein